MNWKRKTHNEGFIILYDHHSIVLLVDWRCTSPWLFVFCFSVSMIVSGIVTRLVSELLLDCDCEHVCSSGLIQYCTRFDYHLWEQQWDAMDTHTGTHTPIHTGTVQAPVLNSKVHRTQSHMPAHHSFADQRPIALLPASHAGPPIISCPIVPLSTPLSSSFQLR